MNLRSGEMPENAANRPANVAGSAAPTAQEWRVAPASAVFKGVGALVFLASAALFANDPTRVLVAAFAGVLLAVFALRDVLAPVRLAADAEGVTVIRGYVGRRQVPWARVERVRVDQRSRLGMRSELLEIDTGESLHLFSRAELNAPVAEVVEALDRIRQLAPRHPDVAGH